MKRTMLIPLLSVVVSAADLSGQWNLHLVRFGEEFAAIRIDLKAQSTTLTGTVNDLKLAGTIEGDHVRLTATRPNGNEWWTLDGRVQGDDMAGTGKQGPEEFEWNAHRSPVVSTAPQVHHFDPKKFHRAFSGAIPPVLHINPGDTI